MAGAASTSSTRRRLANTSGALSIAAFIAVLVCAAHQGDGNMNATFCSVCTFGTLPLLVLAAVLASPHWLWLLVPYALLFILDVFSHLRFSF